MLAALSAPLAFSAGAAAPAAVTRAAAPSMMAKSKALPFLEQPAHLDGTYAGDAVRRLRPALRLDPDPAGRAPPAG